jgi:hypothetical protein
MMWIAKQWAQVTAGVEFALLGKPERFLPHAVGKWLLSLRDFLADSQFTITHTPSVYVESTDRILTDDALAGFYTNSEKRGIKRCRLYLLVECVSDICTADDYGSFGCGDLALNKKYHGNTNASHSFDQDDKSSAFTV